MPAIDNFSRQQTLTGDPATNAVLITPNDSTDLVAVTRAVYVGTGGNMKVTMQDSGTVLFTGIPTGTTLPIRVSRIWSTTTTASTIIALSQIMKIGLNVALANSINWFASIQDAIELAIDSLEFTLNSLTRGNLDNDILGQ